MFQNMQKRIFTIFLAAILFNPYFGQTTTDAGVTPDSFLYGLDTALDQLSLLLTFDEGAKARKGLEIAQERLLEVRSMVEENKLEAAEKAQNEHAKTFAKVEKAIENLENTNSTEQIEEEIEIETELEKHKTRIETVSNELKVKIKVQGEITSSQQTLIDSILANLDEDTVEVEIKIKNKKGETKIKIKQETGRSDEEIEIEIESIEKRHGLKEIKKEKAWDKIQDAEEHMNKRIEKLAALNVTNDQIIVSLDMLEQAKELFGLGNYTEARNLAKQAKNNLNEYWEEFDEDEEEDELEIEVEIKGNIAKVKVKLAGLNSKFILETTDTDEIISEISERTGLSTIEIEAAMELEVEEEEIEIEVEIKGNTTKVKVKINGKETKLTLSMNNRDEIISQIVSATGLSQEVVEKHAEFEVDEEEETETDSDDDETTSSDDDSEDETDSDTETSTDDEDTTNTSDSEDTETSTEDSHDLDDNGGHDVSDDDSHDLDDNGGHDVSDDDSHDLDE